MVSVDVKHHVYLLSSTQLECRPFNFHSVTECIVCVQGMTLQPILSDAPYSHSRTAALQTGKQPITVPDLYHVVTCRHFKL